MLAVVLLAGCTAGPAPETTLADVRVVALDAATPELAAGATVVFDALVADPLGGGTQVAVWTDWGLDGPLTLTSGSPEGEHFVTAMAVPATLEATIVDVWVLACRDDLCAVLDDVDANVEPPTLLEGLPFDGVSLARRSLVVSTRPVEERNTNPVLTVDPPASFSPDAPVDVVVEAEDADGDAITVAPYATGGGFGTILELLVDAEPSSLPLYGPADGDTMRIYVTATDGVGGSASWSGDVPVE